MIAIRAGYVPTTCPILLPLRMSDDPSSLPDLKAMLDKVEEHKELMEGLGQDEKSALYKKGLKTIKDFYSKQLSAVQGNNVSKGEKEVRRVFIWPNLINGLKEFDLGRHEDHASARAEIPDHLGGVWSRNTGAPGNNSCRNYLQLGKGGIHKYCRVLCKEGKYTLQEGRLEGEDMPEEKVPEEEEDEEGGEEGAPPPPKGNGKGKASPKASHKKDPKKKGSSPKKKPTAKNATSLGSTL